jgi:hypothetical protein
MCMVSDKSTQFAHLGCNHRCWSTSKFLEHYNVPILVNHIIASKDHTSLPFAEPFLFLGFRIFIHAYLKHHSHVYFSVDTLGSGLDLAPLLDLVLSPSVDQAKSLSFFPQCSLRAGATSDFIFEDRMRNATIPWHVAILSPALRR